MICGVIIQTVPEHISSWFVLLSCIFVSFYVFAWCVNRGRARLRVCFTVQRRLFPKENETHDDFQKAPEQQVNNVCVAFESAAEARTPCAGLSRPAGPGSVFGSLQSTTVPRVQRYLCFSFCSPPGARRTTTPVSCCPLHTPVLPRASTHTKAPWNADCLCCV